MAVVGTAPVVRLRGCLLDTCAKGFQFVEDQACAPDLVAFACRQRVNDAPIEASIAAYTLLGLSSRRSMTSSAVTTGTLISDPTILPQRCGFEVGPPHLTPSAGDAGQDARRLAGLNRSDM